MTTTLVFSLGKFIEKTWVGKKKPTLLQFAPMQKGVHVFCSSSWSEGSPHNSLSSSQQASFSLQGENDKNSTSVNNMKADTRIDTNIDNAQS